MFPTHPSRDGSTIGGGTAQASLSIPPSADPENFAPGITTAGGEKRLREVKGLAALASNAQAARRSVLGDRSNITASIITDVGRNFRSTTLQTIASTRAKQLSGSHASHAGIVERSCSAATTTESQATTNPHKALSQHNKENIPPNFNSATTNARDWDDLDAEDLEDPLMVAEYVVEIFDYMHLLEKDVAVPENYMETQKELNWHSRSVLIDWLIEVQWKLKLLPETLFLTVNIIDRFLSKRSVSLVKLQLVGMAATLLASKYEEVLSPSIANFVYLSDNAYDEQELLKAERYMLHVLNFSLAYPSPLVFLRRISKAEDYDVRSRTLAKYLMEVALLDYNFVACPPSLLAATTVYLAREMLRSGPWNANLRHYSGEYSEIDIQPWAMRLLDFLKKPVTYEAVFKKYALKKMMKASLFVQEYMKRTFNIPLHTIKDDGKSVFAS